MEEIKDAGGLNLALRKCFDRPVFAEPKSSESGPPHPARALADITEGAHQPVDVPPLVDERQTWLLKRGAARRPNRQRKHDASLILALALWLERRVACVVGGVANLAASRHQ